MPSWQAVNPGQAGKDLPRILPHPWTDIGGVPVRYAVIRQQPELTARKARCLSEAHALQPSFVEGFQPRSILFGGLEIRWGRWQKGS